jgi:outer membrane receptor protein involved in Fe transport
MFRITGGVINTLTPDATTRQAESLREQDFSLDFRHAGKLAESWFYKISAGMRNSGDFTVSRNPDVVDRPEYYLIEPEEEDEQTPFCLLVGEIDCLPKEKSLFREQDDEIRYGALRLDKYLYNASLLTFEAGISDMGGPVFQTGIGRVQNLDAQRPFFRFNYSSEHWNVLAHYSERQGDQVNLTKALVVNDELITDTKRYGVEGQWNHLFVNDKLRFVIGAAHTEERVDTENPETGEQTVVYEPIATDRQAVFSQLDYRANKHVSLVFAGRVDANTLHETQFSPKAALVYSINPKNSLRFTYNQAFQVANYSEFFLHTRISAFPLGGFIRFICETPTPVPMEAPIDCNAIDVDENGFVPILAVGNDDLRLEKTKAWEVGYSGLFANKVFLTVDYYNANNEDFITDLIPQVGTIPGTLEGCVDSEFNPQPDPKRCPVNPDYLPWIGPEDWETTLIIDPSPFDPEPPFSAATGLRNAVDNSVGGSTLGFRLAQDLDGSTVVVGRTYTNVGQVDTQGVDVGLQYFITPFFNMQVSYSWFDYEIIDENEDVRAILLPNTPEHKASVAFSFVKDRWAANLGARWVQGFRWSAGVFQGDVPDYSNVDLSASYGITEMMRIGFNVANLRNTVHRQTFGGDLLARRALINLTYGW